MNIRDLIRSDIEKSIKKAGFESNHPVEVAYPTDPKFGDYTTNWPLQVAKVYQQPPSDIAKKIQINLPKSEIYDSPKVAPPGFLNFNLSNEFLGKHLRLVLAEREKFGSTSMGKSEKVVVEYSSPNIAKPMHAGHLRNTNLGASLVKILAFLGYQTISDNHLGDWGTQFGQLLYAYKTWGQDLKEPTVKDLLDLYVKFNKQAESDPQLLQLGRAEFKKLESGDQENRSLWEKFRETSLREFEQIYQELGANFDHTYGESFYEKDLVHLVKEALADKVAKRDPDGSVIIALDNMTPLLILKSDGATIYGTRDLATAKYRIEKFEPNKVIYVVGSEHALYMRQVFAALQKLNWGKEIDWIHVSYGLTRLPQGKMATRKGELVTARDILDQAYKLAEKVIKEKDNSKEPDQKLVRAVAVGALKWNDLKVSRESEVVFDWGAVFSIEGNTGPYIQYSYARTQNILSKADPSENIGNFAPSSLKDPSEIEIMRQLVKFPEIVEEAGRAYYPHLICTYLFELSQAFSRFYESVPVLSAASGTKEARLGLVAAVGTVLKNGLNLLGIAAPDRL